MNESHAGQLPHSPDSEHAVLGALLLAPEALTELNLSAEDFYSATNRVIFQAIQARAEKGLPFDAVTLGDDFAGNELVHPSYLVELATTVPSAANIAGYAATVKDKAVRRQLIEAATQLDAKARNCAEPAATIAESMSMLALAASRAQTTDTEPLDLFGDQPFPVLEKDWLPPGIARYAYDQAEIVGMAPEMMAFAALATIAAATHDRIVIRPKSNESWTVRACMWLMVIAPPGSTKSQAVRMPLRPLRAIEAEMRAGYNADMAAYVKADKLAKAQEKAAIAAEAKGNAGYSEPVENPTRPPHKRIIVNDITTEKLCELAADNPRGLLYYTDELAVWFGSHDAYAKGSGGKDRAIALQARDGGRFTVDRINRGTLDVDNLSYSLIGTTQPAKIREATSKMSDDGLLQRFTVVEVPNQALYGDEDRQEDVAARKSYEDTIEAVWRRVPLEGTQCVVSLSPQADAIRRDFHKWVVKVSSTEGLPEMLRASISKWKSVWPELALIYHSYGSAASGKWPSDLAVSGTTATRVTNLLKRYLLPQALRFYTDTVAGSDLVYGVAQKAAGLILSRGLMRITNRELTLNVTAWRTAQEYQKQGALNLLKESGWLLGADTRRATGAESGWTVNPRVHVLFGQRAAIERAKRADAAEGIKALRDAAAGRG